MNGDAKADISDGAPDECVSGNAYQGRSCVFLGTDGDLLPSNILTPPPPSLVSRDCHDLRPVSVREAKEGESSQDSRNSDDYHPDEPCRGQCLLRNR